MNATGNAAPGGGGRKGHRYAIAMIVWTPIDIREATDVGLQARNGRLYNEMFAVDLARGIDVDRHQGRILRYWQDRLLAVNFPTADKNHPGSIWPHKAKAQKFAKGLHICMLTALGFQFGPDNTGDSRQVNYTCYALKCACECCRAADILVRGPDKIKRPDRMARRHKR